jgi:hypothetical protein
MSDVSPFFAIGPERKNFMDERLVNAKLRAEFGNGFLAGKSG